VSVEPFVLVDAYVKVLLVVLLVVIKDVWVVDEGRTICDMHDAGDRGCWGWVGQSQEWRATMRERQ
jgi:hypothetical protein